MKTTMSNAQFRNGLVTYTLTPHEGEPYDVTETIYELKDTLRTYVTFKDAYLKIDDPILTEFMSYVELEVNTMNKVRKHMMELCSLNTEVDEITRDMRKLGYTVAPFLSDLLLILQQDIEVMLDRMDRTYIARSRVDNCHVKVPDDILQVCIKRGFKASPLHKNMTGQE